MATPARRAVCLLVFPLVCGVLAARGRAVEARESVGLEVKCEEFKMRITARRRLFDERRVPFEPRHLRLGATAAEACGPRGPPSGSEMVIYVGLRECGTTSSVHSEWLVYSNKLMLLPAVVPVSAGSVIVKASVSVIPVECRYRRKQTVTGEPLTPTWLPMTSTISAVGLLRFSLHAMAGDCSSPRSSSVYQQGEAVYLEASVEAALHPPLAVFVDSCVATLKPDPSSSPRYEFIAKHGCLMDSVLPGSTSEFLPREQDNRLCFSVQAFHFQQASEGQMFISCHLSATLRQTPRSRLHKACFFHRPTFSWRSTEGGGPPCECCGARDCPSPTAEGNGRHAGRTSRPETVILDEVKRTVGPLHTLPRSHWTGRLSVRHSPL